MFWRLGIYGKSLPFASAKRLLDQFRKRGEFGRRQFLMELKMKGLMMSRFLSHQNVQVKLTTVTRCAEFDLLYDRCAYVVSDKQAPLTF